MPGPRGRREHGDARVLLQRLRRPGPEARRVGPRDPTGPARCPRTATTATTSTSLPGEVPGGDHGGRRQRGGRLGRWALGLGADPGRDRGQPGATGRPFRRLEDRELAPRRGLGGAGGGPAARGRHGLRGRRRDLVPVHELRRRQGPGDLPVERPADLLRVGHRLRHREVQPRLRPPHLCLGCRPPRDGGAAAQRRRRDGLRQGRRRGAADGLGPFRARRPGSLDVEARRASSSPSTSCSARSGWTPRAGSSPRVRRRAASTSTSSSPRSSRTRTPSTTSSTPTPGSRRSCARRPTPGSSRRRTSGARWQVRPRRPWLAPSFGCRRSSRTRRPPRETQGVTTFATDLATTFHAFYRDARVVDETQPERSAARLALVEATRITLGERPPAAGDQRARIDVGAPSGRRPTPRLRSRRLRGFSRGGPGRRLRSSSPWPGRCPGRPRSRAGS